ncbi:MAG: formylglycine-generating enzyme family protein [Spirochaetes bacterium]|nr:MAG: formylglycine-generating enzyme family protein [Spirochaetota bacterium]
MEFVFVPGGTFSMGSPESEGGSSERPQHKVTVNGFWMAKYECTQAQYEAVMGDNASGFKAKDNPAESVSWDDAKKFCGKFKNKNDIAIRLPTEAEWEYACRAGTGTRYYWGDEMDGAYCWFVKNSEQKTHPVGSRQPNGFGLYDMSGNVSEWCADAYDERYYKNSPEKDPAGPGNGDRHVVRGGSWCLIADYMRSAFRDKYLNSYHNNYIGFRPVLEAPLPRKK